MSIMSVLTGNLQAQIVRSHRPAFDSLLVLCSEFWPHKLNHNFIIYVYTFIVAVLFLGPQDRPHNFALTAFWGYWWPGIFLVYPFLGRIWCSSESC